MLCKATASDQEACGTKAYVPGSRRTAMMRTPWPSRGAPALQSGRAMSSNLALRSLTKAGALEGPHKMVPPNLGQPNPVRDRSSARAAAGLGSPDGRPLPITSSTCPLQLSISLRVDMPFRIDEVRSAIEVRSAVISNKGPVSEPLLGRPKQDQMLVLEEQLVPGTRDANEDLLSCLEVCEQESLRRFWGLDVAQASDDERRCRDLSRIRRIPAPERILNGCTKHTVASPGTPQRIGRDTGRSEDVTDGWFEWIAFFWNLRLPILPKPITVPIGQDAFDILHLHEDSRFGD